MENYRFQVNLGGMIEILSDHLYSSPDVYIRELLQNGVDAIVAREKAEPGFVGSEQGRILVDIKNMRKLSFRDNGIGLTRDEIHRFLAVIGESSKRDLESGKILSDYIGRFGIGLLSCFMVSDEIRIRTRSIHDAKGYEWIGKPDGTYELNALEEEIPCGTEISLTAKEGAERFLSCETVEELILHYGLILPYPILMNDGQNKKRLNPVTLPWNEAQNDKSALMLFGQMMFKEQFLDCVPLRSTTGSVEGVAYFLPYSVQASVKQKHMVYLKNMLLTENGEGILPDWAIFVRCIINAKDLRPTASREGFYLDDDLREVKAELGECIASYLKAMAKRNKEGFRQFMDIHELAVRSMANADDELFHLFIDELTFVTTKGEMTGLELRLSNEPLRFCGMREYRQLSQIFVSQGQLLINCGYVYSQDLLKRMGDCFGLDVQSVDSYDVEELLHEVNLEEAELAVPFLRAAEKALAEYDCAVEMKQFIPANLPAFYYLDQNALLCRDIAQAMDTGNDVFVGMLGNFMQEFEDKKASTIYFNMRNPLIRKLVKKSDEASLKDIIVIIYVQTLLIGGFTLRNNELGIMNNKLLALLEGGLCDDE